MGCELWRRWTYFLALFMAAQITPPPSSPVLAPAPLAEVSPSKVVELYCTCRQPEHGDMIACDNEECPSPDEWYHVDCVCLNEVIDKWYCTSCKALGKKKKKKSRKRVGGRPSGSAAVELSGEQTISKGLLWKAACSTDAQEIIHGIDQSSSIECEIDPCEHNVQF